MSAPGSFGRVLLGAVTAAVLAGAATWMLAPPTTQRLWLLMAVAAVVVALVFTFVLGVYPGPFFEAAREAVFSSAQVLAGG